MKSIFNLVVTFAIISTTNFARASEEGFDPQDEVTYKALRVTESLVARGANSLHYSKVAGRLMCQKTTTADHIVVGYMCFLNDVQ